MFKGSLIRELDRFGVNDPLFGPRQSSSLNLQPKVCRDSRDGTVSSLKQLNNFSPNSLVNFEMSIGTIRELTKKAHFILNCSTHFIRVFSCNTMYAIQDRLPENVHHPFDYYINI